MPTSRLATWATSRIANPIVRQIAGRKPPMALVHHRGRKSGKPYATPVMTFRTETGFVIALTYGPHTDWVRNLLATGTGSIEYDRQLWTISGVSLVEGDVGDYPIPEDVAAYLKRRRVIHFLVLIASPAQD